MIGIVNYGLGNIKAFANIYKEANIAFEVVETPETLRIADKFILPGVGSFDEAMKLLRASNLADPLNEQVLEKAKPVLGICVGMQMLARSSEEGVEAGLGWINGVVRKLALKDTNARRLLPHMGWNTIAPDDDPLLAGLGAGSEFYFLHSYYFQCSEPEASIATADYGGPFTCAVRSGNIYGVQFHPEKSHHNGVRLLKNFAAL